MAEPAWSPSLTELSGFMLVALIWGCTNPLLKRGAAGIETAAPSGTIPQLRYLLTRWQYVAPFAANQLGSVVYYYSLSTAPLSVASPVTNALTFAVTSLVGGLLGERGEGSARLPNRYTLAGMALVAGGVYVAHSD